MNMFILRQSVSYQVPFWLMISLISSVGGQFYCSNVALSHFIRVRYHWEDIEIFFIWVFVSGETSETSAKVSVYLLYKRKYKALIKNCWQRCINERKAYAYSPGDVKSSRNLKCICVLTVHSIFKSSSRRNTLLWGD